MADINGRWKAPPYVWMTLAGWLITLGIQFGVLWNLKGEVSQLKIKLDEFSLNYRTRAEGDEIIKRFEVEMAAVRLELAENRARILVIERRK